MGIDNLGEDFLEKYWDYEKIQLVRLKLHIVLIKKFL